MSDLVLTGSARTGSYTRALGAALADALPDGVLAPVLTALPYALRGKQVVAVAASPGAVGGARAVVALRTVLGNADPALAA